MNGCGKGDHQAIGVVRVIILNSENHTNYEFFAHQEKLDELKELALTVKVGIDGAWGNEASFAKLGVDSAAIYGMSLIFETIPMKFPVGDILTWLVDHFNSSLSRIEEALVQFAKLHG
jgi:hypothetical protein